MCNARCIYCYENQNEFDTMTEIVENATVEFIKKEICLSPLEKHSIDWFGGEPLLVPKLIERIAVPLNQFAENNGLTLYSEIVTNGSLINDEKIAFLKRIGVRLVHISLDGMRDEYFKRKNYLDGKNHFDHVIASVDVLQQNGFRVMLRINVDRNNISSCEELIEYLHNNVSVETNVHVAPLYGIGKDYLSHEDVLETMCILQKKIDDNKFPVLIRKSINSKKCRNAQQNNYVIKPNGDIIRCEHMYAYDLAIIGTVFDGIIDRDNCICNECDYFMICKQGCNDETEIACNCCWKAIWR